MEPLSTNLFSVNDPLPVLPNFSQNGQLGLGTRYGAEIRIILKLGAVHSGVLQREPLSTILAFR